MAVAQRQLKLGERFFLTGYTPSDRADHVYRAAEPFLRRGACVITLALCQQVVASILQRRLKGLGVKVVTEDVQPGFNFWIREE